MSPPALRDLAPDAASSAPLWQKRVPASPAPASETAGLAQEPRTAEAARREGLLPTPLAPLLQAAAQGNADQAREAIARGDDLNATDARGRTALMLAAGRGDTTMVQLLLGAGADPARADAEGRTAADLARAAGHAAVAEALTRAR